MLGQGRILMHHFVLGELAIGHSSPRAQIISDLSDLPRAETAMDYEVLRFIEAQSLSGIGIGYIDAHLLTSVRLTPETALWTRDKRLHAAAAALGMAAKA